MEGAAFFLVDDVHVASLCRARRFPAARAACRTRLCCELARRRYDPRRKLCRPASGMISSAGAMSLQQLRPGSSGLREICPLLMARRPTKVAAIALANKLARMAWVVMAKGERDKEPDALAA